MMMYYIKVNVMMIEDFAFFTVYPDRVKTGARYGE